MLSLYHSPDSRSSRFIWLLEELGVDYRLVYCSIPRRSGNGAPDPSNPHPDKRVPALVHDGALITESAAIALYLTDLYPERRLGPSRGEPNRGVYLSWLAYYAGEIEPAFAAKLSGQTDSDPLAAKAYDRVIARVSSALKADAFLLNDSFSAADVLVSSIFEWFRDAVPPYAELDDWLERLAARPAARRALAKDARPSGG
ncbi:glutathione S-transferase family protein [Rhodanobacter umsongensis]|uniref:Glutathione S-transferase family protein n=1 Tax=Rhodanobacter umsongensis TaxID=633153 RepID=A0ABW0JNV0_9GAMM